MADTLVVFMAMSRHAVSVSGACRTVPVVSPSCDDGYRKFVSGDEVVPTALNVVAAMRE